MTLKKSKISLRVYSAEFFIKKGKFPLGTDKKQGISKVVKFLCEFWEKEAKHYGGTAKKNLPSRKQMLSGGKLPKKDLNGINEQINDAVTIFVPKEKRPAIKSKIQKSITGDLLSVNVALREKTNDNYDQMLMQAKELYYRLKEFKGETYPALMLDTNGKIYFAKGWQNDKDAVCAPFHEAIHGLQHEGIIKSDVPFASVAECLYGLEKGLFKINLKLKTPRQKDFNKKPRMEKGSDTIFYESKWAYRTGFRIGQWIYLNIPESKRWKYLILRCNLKTHNETIRKLKLSRKLK
ncbi:MAG: hypothetical protein V1672_01415 [Candidatus Diapherotrites archaeon]